MRILFETIEEKEEYIEETALYDEYDECDIYICPACGERYEDFESCLGCCACAKEEVYNADYSNEDEEDF